jgi:transcriptional regulator with XRE-family HTH domain
MGAVLKQARLMRQLSTSDAARAAGISGAYLSKLENDAVKKPSPHVLHQLSEVLVLPYAELMRLSGYRVPGGTDHHATGAVSAALFADLSDDEQEELVEYLAWYRARRRMRASANRASTSGCGRATAGSSAEPPASAAARSPHRLGPSDSRARRRPR